MNRRRAILVGMRGICVVAGCLATFGCFAGSTDVVCGEGVEVQGDTCVAPNLSCGPFTELSQTQECVSPVLDCGDDGVESDGTCVLNPEICPSGFVFDQALGRCSADVPSSCGEGTIEVDGQCLLSCEQEFEVVSIDGLSCVPAALLRALNASTDPDFARTVFEIGAEAIELGFGAVNPLTGIGIDSEVRVRPAESTSPRVEVLDGFQAGTHHLVLAFGVVDANETPFTLSSVEFPEASDVPRLALFHAAADITTIVRLNGASTVETLAFAERGSVFTVEGAQPELNFEFDSRPVDFRFETSSFPDGPSQSATGWLVFIGFENPPSNQSQLELLFVPPEGPAEPLVRLD